ncbi:5-oxoprolinase subunit C family protein [Kutzneria chonburiensis]|uniref:Biotin-dependent carboxyltransferase family protein n=1 Tax=Kutzneria chonburiensis TaxID=1483604 RepID=A0ABV6MQN8_9PSEU|nr:allophanate hydrolase [Kutzneria chonburiensis]
MFEVLAAGIACVTDLGRPGLSRKGIAVNGAADQFSATAANILVGNPESAPLVEITASALTVGFARAALVAVTGAPATVACDGQLQRTWQPICVPAGATLSISDVHSGLRCYLAVCGTLQVSLTHGSCAPDTLLGVGTWLRAGSRVPFDTDYVPFDHPVFRHPLFRLSVPVPRFGSPWTISVTDGPDLLHFGRLEESLFAAPYLVTPDSNHIGLRLRGPAPVRTDGGEILSRGVPVGAIEVTPAGELLVLQRGRPVTAGYPVAAVATSVARSALGQAAPGDVLRFRRRSLSDAVATCRAQRHSLDTLATRVCTVLTRVGIHPGVNASGTPGRPNGGTGSRSHGRNLAS